MSQIGKLVTAGPQPGMDYGKIAGTMPEIEIRLKSLNKVLFDATPLVFAELISPTPDNYGHMIRLIITREERSQLIQSLNAKATNWLSMTQITSSAQPKSYWPSSAKAISARTSDRV